MSKSVKEIVKAVYEQGVVDEHGEIKPGEMIYPDMAIQPKEAEAAINAHIEAAVREALNKVKYIYMMPDYEGTDDDMIQEIIKVVEAQLQDTKRGNDE